MKMKVSRKQYQALNKLRGLPDGAHLLLMTSLPDPDGGTLNGPKKAFTELVEHINEDLAGGMLSAADARALAALCLKIDPQCGDWLGM